MNLHRAQISILYTLRHNQDARFSTLMRPTGMLSDVFKYHIAKLVAAGLVEKTTHTTYRLTSAGKEYANKLDKADLAVQRQPKLSVLLIVPRPGSRRTPQYLFQKRLRSPFFGYWSCIGGPLLLGQDAADTAAGELKKQTGLTATCTVRAFYRKRDYGSTTKQLLEDKLFIVLQASQVEGELSNDWHGGENCWMTAEQFTGQPKYFPSVCEAIDMLKAGKTYAAADSYYTDDQY